MTVTRLEVQRRPAPAPGRSQRPPQRPERPREAAVAPEAPASTLSRTARRAAAEDAKLLAALRVLLSNPSLFPRLFYLALGFAAITSLGVALAGMVPLPYGLRYAVIPAVAIMAARTSGRLVGDDAMTRSTSAVAVWRSSVSVTWRLLS